MWATLCARSAKGGSDSPRLQPVVQDDDIPGMESLLSVRDVAALLGVSRAQVYRYVEAGLPCVRLSGRVLRFRSADVEGWVDELASAAEPAIVRRR